MTLVARLCRVTAMTQPSGRSSKALFLIASGGRTHYLYSTEPSEGQSDLYGEALWAIYKIIIPNWAQGSVPIGDLLRKAEMRVVVVFASGGRNHGFHSTEPIEG